MFSSVRFEEFFSKVNFLYLLPVFFFVLSSLARPDRPDATDQVSPVNGASTPLSLY